MGKDVFGDVVCYVPYYIHPSLLTCSALNLKVIDSAVGLQKQNEDLKQLLDKYLGSKVNEELQVPPTHAIRVVSGAAPA
jgi:hypothetical protein